MVIDLQTAVLSADDSIILTVLFKTAPEMLTHTETDPSASLSVYEDCTSPTCTTATNDNPNKYRVVHVGIGVIVTVHIFKLMMRFAMLF